MLGLNSKAENLFNYYRSQVEKSVDFYSRLQTRTPGVRYPVLARKIWREGLLAEIWATIATRLNGHQIDYLQQWREGKLR